MKNNLMLLTQNFFQKYLPNERGFSQHTVYSYRDTLKVYFSFLSQKNKKPKLDDMTAQNVINFLDFLKSTRNNSVKTQNQRLAVLKCFYEYLRAHDPIRSNQYSRIEHIKMKRAPRRPIEYFDKEEVKAILDSVDRGSRNGDRDYALLKLLYNSGARVQELCDLRVRDIRAYPPYLVELTGKGRKTRKVPLWKDTVLSLESLIKGRDSLAPVFCYQEKPLGRFGVRYIVKKHCKKASQQQISLQGKKIGPHTFRHTTAMHLLQSGTDISVIKTWLGHVDLNTTHGYIEIDLEMKRKAMNKISKVASKNTENLLKKNKDIVSWLSNFK